MKKIILLLITCTFFYLKGAFAQPGSSVNAPSKTTYPSGAPTGPSVYGVFEGRSPCQEICREVNIDLGAQCTHRKWGLILYHNSISHQPTTYELSGLGRKKNGGKWHIVKGTDSDPKAIVYQLELNESNATLFLLKGDDNVLFILDRNKNFLVGNPDFSYTLNRVIN